MEKSIGHGAGSVRTLVTAAAVAIAVAAAPTAAHAGYEKEFATGSLIIPMDRTYQETGLFQAYGLLFQLLRHGVTVYWVIDPDKTWHDAPCDAAGEECSWDCAEQGSGVKCDYPTASPDFFADAEVVWDGAGATPGDSITDHGYRGGPFVIDAGDATDALTVIDVWNDPDTWPSATWAERTVFEVVTVHQTTSAFTGYVRKEMVAAPTIAVFSDGNETIATGYLRAAGIPQSNGAEFPTSKCGADNCGPGTDNPDMLTVPSIMGDMGTCDAVNYDHKNGALFTDDGVPAYCQIMSMHWDVNDRNTVQCDGGGCPATQDQCGGETITYHGHEVVAEVRKFLEYPVHFFAECQAVNAYENTVPDPAWPFLDDDERRGHFLTTEGTPPACPCTDADFECVTGGCDGGATDCCLPKSVRELGAGFLIATQPDTNDLQILHPEVPYNQLDGVFATTNGSEPAYNLSSYLGTEYINDREVTFITGPDGPGDQDVWMTGYLDGECDIGDDDVSIPTGDCNSGKVSYLGGHNYGTDPTSDGSMGTRMFLNALFEADCVTSIGQPDFALGLQGDITLISETVPAQGSYTATYANQGRGVALDATLEQVVPAAVTVVDAEAGGSELMSGYQWPIGSIAGNPAVTGDPPSSGNRWTTLEFPDFGDYDVELTLSYRVGLSTLSATRTVTVHVGNDSDGDGVIDANDPDPNDAHVCGDSDGDTCDDCAVAGHQDPANDGPDSDGDGICDAGEDNPGDGEDSGGCGCRADSGGTAPWLLLLLWFGLRRRRTAEPR